MVDVVELVEQAVVIVEVIQTVETPLSSPELTSCEGFVPSLPGEIVLELNVGDGVSSHGVDAIA